MKRLRRNSLHFIFIFFLGCTVFTVRAQHHFTILPLGVYGGGDEGNLSCYLIAPFKDTAFIALDGGTINDGLRAARRHHFFKMDPADFQKNRIKGYLISHPHLDHVAGLIINAPEDSKKPIYGLPFTIQTLKTKYFTWTSWANFANEGEQPALNKYHYVRLQPGRSTPLENTKLEVTAYPLSHAVPGKSTAFLIKNGVNYFLYLGDTGDDAIEQSTKMQDLWQAVAPILKAGQLKGISIECSFPDQQPDAHLFGHLKPVLLMRNLATLDSLAGGNNSHHPIKDLPVIIAHIKPVGSNEQVIHKELHQQNALGVTLIFPKRGRKILL
ncbi:3',5'-cyclic-nucleotide phosphodiesterase [Arachidicoccus rhizosphaerae]|uniref:3',5'-cyclic-nucleotide phosphodiesterase n=1 Tax=Arachidicoccus rhizosphaerae TaxID=551991 RepID=A0A1H4BQG4_9BACT|nr:3',5'-cyclic-nucleotide phosphodiesterase [Arachidicoccus rhizosphaerae]SEA50317.1 3',5'-cyclic-nucleotide phosphodiesterase [Arachidicoccus rhizosphaerae]